MPHDLVDAPSPCVAICRLDAAGAVCIGCGRTTEEIARWAGFDAGQRWAVLQRLARQRRAAAAQG